MDADRVHAYLQVACAGLGFDIGEVWWMSNDAGTSTVAAIEDRTGHESDSSGEDAFTDLTSSTNGMIAHRNNDDSNNSRSKNGGGRKKAPKKRFLQLYTSKAYCDQRSKLVQPHDNEDDADGGAGGESDVGGPTSPSKSSSSSSSSSSSRELSVRRTTAASLELDEEHVLSPRIVEAVTRSTQVVWANCQKTEGLLGRSDIRLQTAIGMPVGLDESGNVWVVVMFSPKNVESSADAIDYLQYISRSAASVSIPCLLPVVGDGGWGGDEGASRPTTTTSATKMLCNGGEEGEVDGDRQQHHHNQQHHLVSIKPRTKQLDHTQELGDGVTAKFVSFRINDEYDNRRGSGSTWDDEDQGLRRRNSLRSAPKDDYGIPILPDSNPSSSQTKRQHALSLGSSFDDVIEDAISDAFDDASFGVWSTIMNAPTVASEDDSNRTPTIVNGGKSKVSEDSLHAEMQSIQERLEEFATAFLGMSVFDVADAWTASSSSYDSLGNCDGDDPTLNCLFTVAATNYNQEINDLVNVNRDATIGTFDGAVGRAFSSGYPVWSSVKELIYDKSRKNSLEICKIETAFAVPIFSAGDASPSCVLCFYSLLPAESVPFVLNFVQKAVRLLWSGLDRVDNPHESVGRELWKSVGPADLGEMAADVEMQKAFIGKKRPRGLSFRDIISDRHRSMSMLTDMEYLSDEESSSVTLPANAADIPLISLASSPAVDPPLFDTQSDDGLKTDPLSPRAVLDSVPTPPQFLFLNSDNDGHWAVQQAVRSVEETLWNGSRGVSQVNLRPEIYFDNSAATQHKQQVQQQPHHHQQTNLFSPQAIQQQQPIPQQQEHRHQYQLNHVIYDNVATQQQHPPLSAMASLPPGVHNDDMSVICANLLEFNAMAKMHSHDSSNSAMSGTSTNAAAAAAAETATSINNETYMYGVYNNSFGRPRTSIGAIPNQPSRHVNDTTVNINTGNIVPMPVPLTVTGPQQNMYCMTSAHPISVHSMDPSLFAMEQKPCRIEGCNELVVSKRPYCPRHCGNRQCEHEGCTKCAQGATRFCIAHGGGRRCTYPGCDKGARDKYFCAAHGGGKRCKMDGCHKSAVGGSLYCTGHGGGKRCSVPGCDKSAQSSTNFCVKHGGGKKCQYDGCMKVARGKTLFCAAHGGGIRCKLVGCNRVAIGKAQRCRSHGGGADSLLDLDYEAVM